MIKWLQGWMLLALLSPDAGGSGGGQVEGGEMPEDEEDEEDSEAKTESESDEESSKQTVASTAELKAALPTATSDQLVAYALAGLTVAQAKSLHASQAGKAPKRPGGPGVKPPAPDAGDTNRQVGLPKHRFLTEADRRAHETGCTVQQAQREIAYENPDLYASYRATFKSNPRFGGATPVVPRNMP